MTSPAFKPGSTLVNPFNRETFIFTKSESPEVAEFEVRLGPGGSGGGNALSHIHPKADEEFTVRSGRLHVCVAGVDHALGPGETLVVPRGTAHSFTNTHVSVPMTRKVLSTLHLVPEHARSQDLVAANAATRVKVIGRRDEGSKKVTPPSKEAMRAILGAADPKFRIKLKFAAATAVRASELHALRWRHFDAAKGEVRIETRVDRWGQEAGTKTEAGVRIIPLGTTIVTMLKAWRLQSRFSRDNDLMFPNTRGRYQDHGTMSEVHFRPTCKRAGVDGVTWHGLRHFGISCWIERGLSPKTVQTFAGHTSMQMTMDRYGHLFPSEDHKTVMDGIADELFG